MEPNSNSLLTHNQKVSFIFGLVINIILILIQKFLEFLSMLRDVVKKLQTFFLTTINVL